MVVIRLYRSSLKTISDPWLLGHISLQNGLSGSNTEEENGNC